MKTAKATKGQPEFDEEIRVPRFIWRVTRAWHPVKNDEEGLKILWARQQKLLEAFDLQFPDQRQPALTVPPALPTLPALHARPAPGRGITLYRTIRFKERIQCIGPSEFTGPRESV